MRITAYPRQVVSMVLLAMCTSVLSPTLSQTSAGGGPDAQWVEVCGPSGVVTVDLSAQESPEKAADSESGPQSNHGGHCPYCQLQMAQHLPPFRTVGFLVAVSPPTVPVLYLHAPRRMFAWAHAPAQAPPSV